jgi:MoaA/NifB/PqqE/SkfB family radical SAM enzyme
MSEIKYCPGCIPNTASAECVNSFQRLGVLKVHWECWSDCNLSCSFCYRTRGGPISTEVAQRMLETIKTAGVTTIVFAGGDPSIRPDITDLIGYARTLNLKVEVQTNAHHIKEDFLAALKTVDLVGLSIDGPDAVTHDGFRGKTGNFNRVVELLHVLNEANVPLIVRSVVSRKNLSKIAEISNLLEGLQSVVRWSLLEFSPIGSGFTNRLSFEISRAEFNSVIEEVNRRFTGPAVIDAYRAEAKLGTYVLITPTGNVYGTTESTGNGVYPIIGSIVADHLASLAKNLPFVAGNHNARYGEVS